MFIRLNMCFTKTNKQGSLKGVRMCPDTPWACLQLSGSLDPHSQAQPRPLICYINKTETLIPNEEIWLLASRMLRQSSDQAQKGEQTACICFQRLEVTVHAVPADKSLLNKKKNNLVGLQFIKCFIKLYHKCIDVHYFSKSDCLQNCSAVRAANYCNTRSAKNVKGCISVGIS